MTTTSAARTRPKIFRARRIGNDPYKPGGPFLAPFMLRLATNAPGVLRTRALPVTGNDCRRHPSKTWVSSRRHFSLDFSRPELTAVMQALRITSHCPPVALRATDVPVPQRGPDEVRIQVEAA